MPTKKDPPGKATTLYANKLEFADGNIMEATIKRVPTAVPGSKHTLKYSLFYGHKTANGMRTVGYDNEKPKGDHRHYGDLEEPYTFTTPEQLVADFLQDVADIRGERPALPPLSASRESDDDQ